MDWNEANVETLRKLCAEGLAFSRIAERLGTTRSAVIGKASRMRIGKSPAVPSRQKPVTKFGKQILTPPHVRKLRDFEAKMKAAPKQEPKQQVVEGAPAPLMLDLLDLTEASCRWPVSSEPPHKFCGHEKVSGSSYCSFHSALAYAGCPPASRAKLPLKRAA